MDYQTILVDGPADLTVITLNRPDVMNALNGQMRAELTQALQAAAQVARVVVLTGAGRGFCSGQDLGDGGSAVHLDVARTLQEEYVPLIAAITNCPVPVIAAVNGPAAGAGANLALMCDVVIAAESAFFQQAFARIGLIPDAGGTWALPRQVGMARATGAMLFADRIPARQAADWGMIYECVSDADFSAHWRTRAAALAQGPTLAFRHLKTALRQSGANTLAEQLTVEAELQGACGRSQDFREGVRAFLDKRPPVFQGC